MRIRSKTNRAVKDVVVDAGGPVQWTNDFIAARVRDNAPFTVREITCATNIDWRTIEFCITQAKIPAGWTRTWIHERSPSTHAAPRRTVAYCPPGFDPFMWRWTRTDIVHDNGARFRFYVSRRVCRIAGFEPCTKIYASSAGNGTILIAANPPKEEDDNLDDGWADEKNLAPNKIPYVQYQVSIEGTFVITPAVVLAVNDVTPSTSECRGKRSSAAFDYPGPWEITAEAGRIMISPTAVSNEEHVTDNKNTTSIKCMSQIRPLTVDVPAAVVRRAGWRRGMTVWAWLEKLDDNWKITIKRGVSRRPPVEGAREHTVDTHHRLTLRPRSFSHDVPDSGWSCQAYDMRIELTCPATETINQLASE